MHSADDLLLDALREAPRRYRMPPLPGDAASARERGTDAALAFAIEAARRAKEEARHAPVEAKELFVEALAGFIRAALAPGGGDPAFQALVLHAQHAEVREFVQLAAQEAADARLLRGTADALAHPGKLRALPDDPRRAELAALHAFASNGEWARLRDAASGPGPRAMDEDAAAQAGLRTLAGSPALDRLLRLAELRGAGVVQQYLALGARRGPLAGSDAAATQGRASARLGEVAEQETVAALRQVAALLQPRDPAAGWRVLRGLHTPRGFPGDAHKAKNEWDVALVRETAEASGARVLLLAEVKASPAAATPDFSRLRRGLLRLAQAQGERPYAFASEDGEVRIAGASLRALQPPAHALPERVIYMCTAPPEGEVQVLGAASKSVLGSEPASLAFALRLARGEAPDARELAPVWEALATAPRLRATLHQFETAQAVREAMLHPHDLLAQAQRTVGSG